MDKFVTACCMFSFIIGMFVAHTIQAGRGCTVAFTHGNETHVVIGREE